MPPSLKLVPPVSPPPAFEGSDEELVHAFRRGDPAAREELHARYAEHVHRVLYRLLGTDGEHEDLHHDVYVRALRSLPKLADPAALKGWLTAIAVHVARSASARRRRRVWLRFLPHDEVPEVTARDPGSEIHEALAATYRVLDELPTDERIAFALRFIEGLELTEVAAACGTSLATIKRRLRRAGARFEARRDAIPLSPSGYTEEIDGPASLESARPPRGRAAGPDAGSAPRSGAFRAAVA